MADVENKSDNILYDLSVLAEWTIEKEIFTRNNREKVNASAIGRISSLIRRTTWTLLRSVGIPMQTATPCLLPDQIVRWKSSLNGWLIAVSSSGTYVAIAQVNGIEIRTSLDGFDAVCGCGDIPHDPYPQWRCMVWSDDETMVVCSRSSGAVDAFDILGTLLFTIPGAPNEGVEPLDLSDAVAALIFTDFKPKDSDWSSELLVVNYHGSMASYFVDRDNEYKLRYTFNFAIEYPRGVAAVTYDPLHKILFVGGMGLIDPQYPSQARQDGLTAWRILSDDPYCKLVTDYQEKHRVQGTTSMLSRWKVNTMMAWKGAPVDGVVHLCLSPDRKTLVSLHYFGKLMLWDVPSLRIRKEFLLENQVTLN